MDYAMPRADVVCDIAIHENPVPTKTNPLGAKGAGEAGCVGSLPAVMIVIMNALEPSVCANSTCPLPARTSGKLSATPAPGPDLWKCRINDGSGQSGA